MRLTAGETLRVLAAQMQLKRKDLPKFYYCPNGVVLSQKPGIFTPEDLMDWAAQIRFEDEDD